LEKHILHVALDPGREGGREGGKEGKLARRLRPG
jgi:hypothetical protein